MAKMIYHGLFFDRNELNTIAELIRNEFCMPYLGTEPEYPHVTFGYRTEPLQGFEPGKEAAVRIIGYGNDTLNEGLLVALDAETSRVYNGAGIMECDALRQCARTEKAAHITTSYDGSRSKPVHTGNIEFVAMPIDLSELILYGTFGWYDGNSVRFD